MDRDPEGEIGWTLLLLILIPIAIPLLTLVVCWLFAL